MKKYKTWEIIRELTEKPYLRFKNGLGSIVTTSKETKEIVWQQNDSQPEDTFIMFNHAANCDNLHIEWVLVAEPVTFLEAVQAYAEGKIVNCDIEGFGTETYKDGTPYSRMLNTKGFAPSVVDIQKGIWTIKED